MCTYIHVLYTHCIQRDHRRPLDSLPSSVTLNELFNPPSALTLSVDEMESKNSRDDTVCLPCRVVLRKKWSIENESAFTLCFSLQILMLVMMKDRNTQSFLSLEWRWCKISHTTPCGGESWGILVLL